MLIEKLHRLDQSVTLFLNSLSTPATDEFWQLMTTQEVWYPMYVIVLYFLFQRLGWKKALVVTVSIVLCVAVCDPFSNFMKYYVGRLRPSYSSEMVLGGVHVLEGRGGFYGFFSGHASNAFSMAVCMILGFRHDRTSSYRLFNIFIIAWAFLVAVSRIFVGKHYFGDVLVGTIVGICVGCLMGMLAEDVIRKWIKAPAALSPSESPATPSPES